MSRPPFTTTRTRGITLTAAQSEEKQDDLDFLIQQTLNQQEESAFLSERLVKTIANTEDIAMESTNMLNSQGGFKY
jgi:hypothetical protein